MAEVELGKVTHYYSRIRVAEIQATYDILHLGDSIHIKGDTSDFIQRVGWMQVDGMPIVASLMGESVGLCMEEHAHENDQVFKVVA